MESTDRTVLSYKERHSHESVALESLAACIHISPPHLCRLFRQATGLTPFQHLARIRIQKAKRVLIESPDLKIGAVAREVGYLDPSAFCAVFRAQERTSPQMFRRLHGVG
jgi:AraC family transcriptional regulator of arabinose operon